MRERVCAYQNLRVYMHVRVLISVCFMGVSVHESICMEKCMCFHSSGVQRHSQRAITA